MKITKSLCLYLIILLVIVTVFANINPAFAASIWDKISCKERGNCQLSDFTQLIINVAQFILGISSSLALLAFVYGGVMFLISSGNNERVTKAKQIIGGAVIGLVIVFASYIIIDFVFKALGIPYDWSTPKWLP